MQTDYPDRSSTLFRPRKNDFKEIASQTYRLLCKVLVQANNVWSDSARVRFGCVLKSPHPPVPKVRVATDTVQLQCIPVAESPFSNKQAAIEISIQPILAKASC